MEPFRIRSVGFVPEQATGTDAVLFFVALDQEGYPGEYLFEGSIPADIVNDFAGALLYITFWEDTNLTGDFHFGVGTAAAAGDSLRLSYDTGGGDATHSLVYIDGVWHVMPEIDHTNSWIMQAEIEYAAEAVEIPVEEALPVAVSPNPFRSTTTLRYHLRADAFVESVILDIAGRRVKGFEVGPQDAGSQIIRWDGTTREASRAPPGAYIWMVLADGRERAQKIVVLE
jgi:hypothetical protein